MRVSVKALSLVLGLLAVFTLQQGSARAQQFSADLVFQDAKGRPVAAAGKLYVGGGIVRIDSPDVRNGRFLVNVGAHTAIFVMPAQHLFMDAKQSSRVTQILVSVDPNDPCGAWRAMAKVAGADQHGGSWHCQRLGSDPIDGRVAIKFRAISPLGHQDYGWVDPQLKFTVKFQFADGTALKLDNVREGPQPAGLFALPANYRKFDPRQLIERIKHSDVWVDPPK
jgi:hypothetical protein